jgi:exodeoxyribonuclease-3
MRILNFNIQFGGGKRIKLILDYILNNDFDLIVLTEFVKNNRGEEIINKLVAEGYKTQTSNKDKNLGSFIACKEDFNVKNVDEVKMNL